MGMDLLHTWSARLEVRPSSLKLAVIDAEGNELLKAIFGQAPKHPRALLTLLEGVALWSEEPLRCVISAEHPVSHSLGLGVFGDEWPEGSALLHFRRQGVSKKPGVSTGRRGSV